MFTAEQLVDISRHAATQEQLDNVRRELDGKIEKVQSNLESKIDSRIDKLDSKIDTNLRWMMGMWLTTLGSIALAAIKLGIIN